MFSSALRSCVAIQTARRIAFYSSIRCFATQSAATPNRDSASPKEDVATLDPNEKQSSKKGEELPDFPEVPFIRDEFPAGIRNRDYIKTMKREKRMDLSKKKVGSVVCFDDEEFQYYFPHEYEMDLNA